MVSAIEFAAMDYWRIAVFQWSVMTPLVAVMVVSFRVHRGIDVFAAIVSAIAACALAERFVDAVDWLLIQSDADDQKKRKKAKRA